MTGTQYPSLKQKVVVITGGATGIGASLVTAFARQGAQVAYVDINAEAAENLNRAITEQGLATPWFQSLDVTDTEALQQFVANCEGQFGSVDVLVNNVANDTRHSPLETTAEQWRQCLAVNIDAAFFACQAVIPLMQGRGGSIINFSSITPKIAPNDMPGYVASKSGLIGLTRVLARQYGEDKIRVNTLSPGWVVTERQLDLWLTPEAEAKWREQVALKDRLMPEDIANVALFLAADDSRMITGQEFVVDAGRT